MLLERGSLQCKASLLVDTGCDFALNLSEYKADQLGLAHDGMTVGVEYKFMSVYYSGFHNQSPWQCKWCPRVQL